MGLISKIKSQIFKSNNDNDIKKFKEDLNSFLKQDRYISFNDKNKFLDDYNEYFKLLDIYNNGVLKNYCKNNRLEYDVYNPILISLSKIDDLIVHHNETFVNDHLVADKDYLDNILKDYDSNIKLDDEQRRVILTDEDNLLVVAGAGAGKTTTVSAKVKYLVDIKKINPKEILVISFTNKAVNELRERINHDLKIKCPITTFHSAGYDIISKNKEKKKIVNENFLYKTLVEFLNRLPEINEALIKKIILFFSYYMDVEDTKDIEQYKLIKEFTVYRTLQSQIVEANLKEIDERNKHLVSILSERLKSHEEVQIANFLYLNNVEYRYEEPYPYYIKSMKRPYLPDFTIYHNGKKIYLEHFGVTENHENDMYSEEKLKCYVETIRKKKELHRTKGTKLIYTYSKYNDGLSTLDHLKQILINEGIELKPRDEKEVYEQLSISKDNSYYRKMLKLLISFINNFKTNGWTDKDFSRLYNENKSERNKVFLELAEQAYLYYQYKLKEIGYVDFHDLINDSKRILDEVKEMNQKLNFKYIIIDEYQDISLQRFNLVKRLSEVTDAKIIAVGDDWQSIYAFAGSKIQLFTDFKKIMGHAEILRITKTYRNSQELIDIAGNFIQKNNSQFKKELSSPKNIKCPVAVFTYSDDTRVNATKGKKGILEEKAKTIEKVLSVIISKNKKENLSILLLGRYSFEGENLTRTGLFYLKETKEGHKKIVSKKYPNLDLEYMTVHSSKGLGRDEVIIINQECGVFGFPSGKVIDPVLNMVIYNDQSYEDAEERRLFYVALTRTKNRVYIVAPKYFPSRFLLEIKDENNVYKDYDFSEAKTIKQRVGNYCPHCGFPLYYCGSKIADRNMYICSNEPELCGFISNNMKGGKASIKKCPSCINGYLFIKKITNKEMYFLGCTNYASDKKGCNYTEEIEE